MSDFNSIPVYVIFFLSFFAAIVSGGIAFFVWETVRLCRRRRFGQLVYRRKMTWLDMLVVPTLALILCVLFGVWNAFFSLHEVFDEGEPRLGTIMQWIPPIMLTALLILLFAYAVLALATRIEIRGRGAVSYECWNVHWKRVRRVLFSGGARLIIEHDRGVCSTGFSKRERADIASALGETGVSIVDDPEYARSVFRESWTVYARPILIAFGCGAATFLGVFAWFYFTLTAEYAVARRLQGVAYASPPELHIWQVAFQEGVEPTDEQLRLLYAFRQLSYLNLCGADLDDSVTKPLARMTQLLRLHLDYTDITDTTLSRLSGLKQLRVLTLSGTRITGDGLRHLEGMQDLEELYLLRTEMTEAGLGSIGKLRSLQKLSLNETPVQDTWLTPLADLPNLNALWLNDTEVTDRGVETLAKFKHIKDLSLSGTRITDASAETLKRMTHLERLTIRDTDISPEVAREIAKVLGNDKVQWRPREEVSPGADEEIKKPDPIEQEDGT